MTQARSRIVVDKDEHKFSCAHMTVFADGSKERLHGHNFRLSAVIELAAEPSAAILDFGRVKAVLGAICAELKEHLLIAARSPALRIMRHDADEFEMELCARRYVVPSEDVMLLPVDNIVVETLARHLWARVAEGLHAELQMAGALSLEVTVTESPGQGATWSAPLP